MGVTYILYDSVNSEGPKKKLSELNASIVNETSPNKKLTDLQLKQINKVIDVLGAKNFYHNSILDEYGLKEYLELIGKWNDDYLIPVFDVYRMLLLHSQSNSLFKKPGGGVSELAVFKSYMKSNKNILLSILAMRIIVNHFNNESTR